MAKTGSRKRVRRDASPGHFPSLAVPALSSSAHVPSSSSPAYVPISPKYSSISPAYVGVGAGVEGVVTPAYVPISPEYSPVSPAYVGVGAGVGSAGAAGTVPGVAEMALVGPGAGKPIACTRKVAELGSIADAALRNALTICGLPPLHEVAHAVEALRDVDDFTAMQWYTDRGMFARCGTTANGGPALLRIRFKDVGDGDGARAAGAAFLDELGTALCAPAGYKLLLRVESPSIVYGVMRRKQYSSTSFAGRTDRLLP